MQQRPRLERIKSLEGRLKQVKSLEERLAEESKRLREQARLLPPGAVREQVLRKARQTETGAHIGEG